MFPPIAVDITEAARLTGQSQATIRRAVKATDPNVFPPPLPARKAGTGASARLTFLVDNLREWVASFPEA